jgi:signal transduction histidine kinase
MAPSLHHENIGQGSTEHPYDVDVPKYSAEDQPVSVGLDVAGTQARVWVRDEGPGVAPEERERIWERFYRAERVEHRSGSSVGLGLGLHISRTIISQHGGEVGVESGAGAGATFWFTLPLDERAAPDVAPAGNGGTRAKGSV